MDSTKLADMAGPMQHPLNTLMPCNCPACVKIADDVGETIIAAVRSTQQPNACRSGALVAALHITCAESINFDKPKDVLREIFLALADEAFDQFADISLRTVDATRARLDDIAGKQH